jgi:ribonucleoside-triphosphate reductase
MAQAFWNRIKQKRAKIWIICLVVLVISVVTYLLITGTKYHRLLSFFIYMSFACTIIPLPTPPFVIGLAKVFSPAIVALTGTIGNCLAGLFDYSMLTIIFSKTELRARIKKNRIFNRFIHYFRTITFVCLIFTALTPIPFEPFRIAAILIRYSLAKYLLAIFIGRLPRYYIMAFIGKRYKEYFSLGVLLLLLAVLLLIPLIIKIVNRVKERRLKQTKLLTQ